MTNNGQKINKEDVPSHTGALASFPFSSIVKNNINRKRKERSEQMTGQEGATALEAYYDYLRTEDMQQINYEYYISI